MCACVLVCFACKASTRSMGALSAPFTGQNPASSAAVAKLVAEVLSS